MCALTGNNILAMFFVNKFTREASPLRGLLIAFDDFWTHRNNTVDVVVVVAVVVVVVVVVETWRLGPLEKGCHLVGQRCCALGRSCDAADASLSSECFNWGGFELPCHHSQGFVLATL